MSDAQTYYDGLISQGYTPEQAVTYTQQYYSDFQPTPVTPTEPIAPVPTPVVPAPISTPEAMVSPAPVQGGGIDIMAIAAVVCITLALVLSAVGQFNGSWLSSDADENGQTASSGLRTITIDCSEITNITEQINCGESAIFMLSEPRTIEDISNYFITPPSENSSLSTQTVTGKTSVYCSNIYNLQLWGIEFTESMFGAELTEERANASAEKTSCDDGVSAGSTGGIVLWLGTIVALAALVLSILGMVGVNLPGGIESHGKWVSLASGVLMILAILVWFLMLPSSEGSTMGASVGVFITVFGAVLAIVSGVLGIVGGMSKSN